MEPDSGYALQKLELAVNDLATGKGNIKERLMDVFVSHLHMVKDHDFPSELREDWVSIKRDITKSGPKTDSDGKVYVGAIQNTLHNMRLKTGSEIASKIVVLAENLRVYLESKNAIT
jgi:outer membrane protein assembly factor BamB